MAKANLHYPIFQCYRSFQRFTVLLLSEYWSAGVVSMGFSLVSPTGIGKFTVIYKGEKTCSYLTE
jgi:hypothetical protein